MMNRTQKLVVTLLIITIVLSVISVSLNFALVKLDAKRSTGIGNTGGAGDIQVIVERNTPVSTAGGSTSNG